MSTFIGMGVSKNKTSKEENKKIKELTETVEALTKKNGELEAEKVSLTGTVEALTKKVSELEKNVAPENTGKNKDKE